jgi:predicted nucleic acid-binding protein
MNLVDSSCWLEYYCGSSQGRLFRKPIEDLPNLVVPTVVLLEVTRRLLQQGEQRRALLAAAHMTEGVVSALDPELALAAAKLGVELRLPLADSIILASARRHGAVLWTQDAHFENLPEVKYFRK